VNFNYQDIVIDEEDGIFARPAPISPKGDFKIKRPNRIQVLFKGHKDRSKTKHTSPL
jgi:hypothetical protein